MPLAYFVANCFLETENYGCGLDGVCAREIV
jgi:hypothetical protein